MATTRDKDLDKFLDELETAGVEVREEDLQSEDWDELDSGEVPAGVRSLPDSTDSIRGSSSGGSPVGSRSSPTLEAGSKKACPAPPAGAAASHTHGGERVQAGPPEGDATQLRPAAATVPKAAPFDAGSGAKAPPSPAAGKPAAARAPAAAAPSAAPTPAQAALAAARARVAAAAAARSAATATRVVGTVPQAGAAGAATSATGGSGSAASAPAGRPAPSATANRTKPPIVAKQAEAAGAAPAETAPAPAAAHVEPAAAAASPLPSMAAAPVRAETEDEQKQVGDQEEAGSGGEEEEEEEQQQELGPGPAAASGSRGKGWGGWGALGKLSATLQAAASTAVKDVSELTESFQQVLQEMAQAPDEVEEGGAGGEAARGTSSRSRPASQGPSQRLPRAASGFGAGLARQQEPAEGRQEDGWEEAGEEEAEELTPEQEARRRAVLEKLEGEDTKLEKSAKVIDAHVEQLSAGAGKALSSLWGWGATLAHKVEAAASTAAKELAETVNEASPAWSSAASGLADAGKPAEGLGRLGDRLGQLGRTARGLLEGGLQGTGRQSGGAAKDEAMSFDECFYVYGGQQAFEELETLSNECARLCNRVRSRLPEDDKANLDKMLALLVPLFDLSLELLADSGEGQGVSAPAEPAALARGHAMVADLAAAGCARADSMAHAASQKAAELVGPPPPPEEPIAPEGADGGTAAAAGFTEGVVEGQQGAAAVAQVVQEEHKPSPAAVKALKAIQSEGVKRVAEVGALCIERLLALARSVSAQFRYGRPADDGISWPAEPESKALLLRLQARKMLSELEAVAESFVAALLGAGRGLNAHTDHKVYGKLSEGLLPELGAASASSRVRDAYKSLMYVVWLSGVDRELVE